MELDKIVLYIERNIKDVNEIGLLYGKMGIAIFFFHYARYSEDKRYEDIAMELVDTVLKNLTLQIPANYAYGLAGIGTGIEYLIQNKFIEEDGNDILTDIDTIVFKELIYQEKKDFSLEKGLCGLGKYFLYRIHKRKYWQEELITVKNRQNIIHLLDRLDSEKKITSLSQIEILYLLMQLYEINIFNMKVEKLIRFYLHEDVSDIRELISRINKIKHKKFDILKTNFSSIKFSTEIANTLNIYECIGRGFFSLTEKDVNNASWWDLIM